MASIEGRLVATLGSAIAKNKPSPKSKVQSGTQSIRRTMALIKAVAEYDDKGARLSEMVTMVKVPSTTAHRILAVLVSEGFIEFDAVSKCYHIGSGLYSSGEKAQRYAIKRKCRLCLENIAGQTLNSVYLVGRSGLVAICIDRMEGHSAIRVVAYDVGSRPVPGFGAASLALLSFLPKDEFESILEANKIRYEKFHNITASEIRYLAQKSRKKGYVFSENFHMEGINGTGMPILDSARNVVATISVGSASDRLDLEHSK